MSDAGIAILVVKMPEKVVHRAYGTYFRQKGIIRNVVEGKVE